MDREEKPDVAALIRDAARSAGDRAGWLDPLLARCWPGGGDRSEPAARAWVRGWGAPKPGLHWPVPVVCGCVSGRCSVCN